MNKLTKDEQLREAGLRAAIILLKDLDITSRHPWRTGVVMRLANTFAAFIKTGVIETGGTTTSEINKIKPRLKKKTYEDHE